MPFDVVTMPIMKAIQYCHVLLDNAANHQWMVTYLASKLVSVLTCSSVFSFLTCNASYFRYTVSVLHWFDGTTCMHARLVERETVRKTIDTRVQDGVVYSSVCVMWDQWLHQTASNVAWWNVRPVASPDAVECCLVECETSRFTGRRRMLLVVIETSGSTGRRGVLLGVIEARGSTPCRVVGTFMSDPTQMNEYCITGCWKKYMYIQLYVTDVGIMLKYFINYSYRYLMCACSVNVVFAAGERKRRNNYYYYAMIIIAFKYICYRAIPSLFIICLSTRTDINNTR